MSRTHIMVKRNQGFTLIELMITVAIIGILAAIAYPSYLDQVRKSRRTDAVSTLVQAANRQERYYTTQYTYASTMDKLGLDSETENDWYSIAVQNADADGFDLVATAQKGQAEDECYTYGLNHLGEKTAENKSGSDVSPQCW